MAPKKGFLERLEAGETIVVAEGYLFEFEERCYLKAGGFVPEVVIDHPELVRDLHREFVHAGSDVVLAFTYYGHRQKLKIIGREDDIEKLNKEALRIAREVAEETGTLLAGNICNSTIYNPADPDVLNEIKEMMAEQVRWASESGVDFIVGETFATCGEAMMALNAILQHGNGVPAVITLAVDQGGLVDSVHYVEACKKLKDAGAAVVGFNCSRGPKTMLPILRELSKGCQGHLAALPVTYRTTEEHPTFQALLDIDNPEKTAFPLGLDAHLCTREHISDFTKQASSLGIRYLGLCCGNRAHYVRVMAEALGRSPSASRYSPDMSQHMSCVQDSKGSYMQAAYQSTYKTNY